MRHRLPEDWTVRYNITPVLIETFVETPRYTGAVYKASGWTRVGTTQGRGRYDTHMKRAQEKHLAAAAETKLGANPQSMKSPTPSPDERRITKLRHSI
ncbi:MAG: DUF4338 domain-containing protein [Alphaproteobacteria bacterium]|nr:DUF4338 domain-containing protein [Alphaproteobacteria bacterium]